MTLRAAAVVPPIVVPGATASDTPALSLPRECSPVRSVPILSPAIRTLDSPETIMPPLPLSEITSPAPALPIVTFDDPWVTSTPVLPLPSPVSPETSVPMKSPCTRTPVEPAMTRPLS